MSAAETDYGQCFKPEIRKQGEALFQQESVFIQSASDTQVKATLRSSPQPRVQLTAEEIGASVFRADCTCSSAAKGQLCKHIWATVLAVGEKYPDFLEGKVEVEKSAARPSRDEPRKAKQAEYRKQQYRLQKQKAKERSGQGTKKVSRHAVVNEPPEEVAGALRFFAENGFAFALPLDANEVANARKVLARVFHPDKGGTHDEALILNEHYETLMMWVE